MTSETQEPRPWNVVAASVRGAGHERAGTPCQDANAWAIIGPKGVLATSVADGAGSAPLAEFGSQVAARAALDALADTSASPEDWPCALRGALVAALTAVEDEAAARDAQPRDLATTLIVVLASESGVAAVQIGDGAVVVQDRAGEMIGITVPRSGEYINETTFLVSPGAIEQAQYASWHGTAAGIAAFSDGLQRLALKTPDNMPHAPFFRPLFDFVAASEAPEAAHQGLAAFLALPRVTARADDDLTLVLAVRRP